MENAQEVGDQARSIAESILITPKHASSQQVADQARSVAESILVTPKHSSNNPSTDDYAAPPIAALDLLTISEDKKSSRPQPSHDLFVGDLARSVTTEQLRNAFLPHGEVLNVDIKKDKFTRNNLGYGFVTMKTRQQADAAKNALNGTELGNRRVRINWAQKNTTLFVGDLDGTVNTDYLRQIFRKFGEIIEEETFVKAGSGKFGFVRFRHRSDAEKAKAIMNKKQIGSRIIRVGWGDNNIQKHCVHLQFQQYEDAKELTEEAISSFFSQFGQVVNVTLPRDTNGKYKGYGFVHFEDNESGEKSAGNVIASMPTGTICGVSVRLSYRKRQARTRGKRMGHSNTIHFRPKSMNHGMGTWAPPFPYGSLYVPTNPYYGVNEGPRHMSHHVAHQIIAPSGYGYPRAYNTPANHSGPPSPLYMPQHHSPRASTGYSFYANPSAYSTSPTNQSHSPLYTSHQHSRSPPYGSSNAMYGAPSPLVLNNMPVSMPPLSLYNNSPRVLNQADRRFSNSRFGGKGHGLKSSEPSPSQTTNTAEAKPKGRPPLSINPRSDESPIAAPTRTA